MRRRGPPKYVHEIPPKVRQKIVSILDGDGSGDWKQLAYECGFSIDDTNTFALAFLKPGGSASDALLTRWSHRRPTIRSLFHKLINIHNIRAAELLRGLVPEDLFNQMINNDEPDEPLPAAAAAACPPVQNLDCDPDDLPGPPPIPLISSSTPDQAGASSQGQGSKLPIPVASSSSGSSYESPNSSESNFIDLHAQRDVRPKESLAQMQVAVLANLHHFPYRSLVAATQEFADVNLLGQGGFGCVYKGVVNKATVAIKFLYKPEENKLESQEILNKRHFSEINSSFSYQHRNIIQVLGYSIDGPNVCLVHEYMQRGSLESCLSSESDFSNPLPFTIRHQILAGSAKGLEFLHTSQTKPMIHGDIKSANILLDQQYVPKIADFGLSKLATGGTHTGIYTHASRSSPLSKVFGSEAYLPAEFLRDLKHNIATDTFSFGIVIYEVCTGDRAFDARREGGKYLKDYVDSIRMTNDNDKIFEIRDKRARDWPREAWHHLMELGFMCAAKKKLERPKMPEVVRRLDNLNDKVLPIGLLGGDIQCFHLQHQPPLSHVPLNCGNESNLDIVESMQKLRMDQRNDTEFYESDPTKLDFINRQHNDPSYQAKTADPSHQAKTADPSYQAKTPVGQAEKESLPWMLQYAYDRKDMEEVAKLNDVQLVPELDLDIPVAPPPTKELKNEPLYVNNTANLERCQNEVNSEQEAAVDESREKIDIQRMKEKQLPPFLSFVN